MTMTTNTKYIAGILSLASIAALHTVQAEQPVFAGEGLLTSRYVTEGTNIAPGSDLLFQGEASAHLAGFTAGAVYVQSLSGTTYNEVNLVGQYGLDLGPVALFGGVTFLTYPSLDDPNSWELFIGFEWEALPGVTLFGETYYDVDDIKGGFLELGVAYELPLDLDPFVLEPYVLVGIDYGYVSRPRALKENNFQVGLEITYDAGDHWEIFAAGHYSFALTNLRNEDLGDIGWVQAGLRFEF